MDPAGYPEASRAFFCLNPAKLSGPRWHFVGGGAGGGGLRRETASEGVRRPLSARNLSSPVRADSGKLRLGGPEVEAVGGIGGVQGLGAGRGLCGWTHCSDRRAASGPCATVFGWCVAAAKRTRRVQGACGWAYGLLREHRHRGRHAAPTGHSQAGPARGR